MSQATRPNDRHIIWSNQNLDVDDWREDYKEFLEANELDDDPNDEQALYEWMEETNYDYLSDERVNLNVQLSQPIIVIGDIGRWNGRVMGYKDIPSGNIRDCLYADTDYTEWYVDKYGDLRADATHHDGTNHYLSPASSAACSICRSSPARWLSPSCGSGCTTTTTVLPFLKHPF